MIGLGIEPPDPPVTAVSWYDRLTGERHDHRVVSITYSTGDPVRDYIWQQADRLRRRLGLPPTSLSDWVGSDPGAVRRVIHDHAGRTLYEDKQDGPVITVVAAEPIR